MAHSQHNRKNSELDKRMKLADEALFGIGDFRYPRQRQVDRLGYLIRLLIRGPLFSKPKLPPMFVPENHLLHASCGYFAGLYLFDFMDSRRH